MCLSLKQKRPSRMANSKRHREASVAGTKVMSLANGRARGLKRDKQSSKGFCKARQKAKYSGSWSPEDESHAH